MHYLTLLCALLPLAAGRKITIINSCRQTVWPGMFANPGPMPDHATGWEMKPGEKEEIEVSDKWQSGRIHVRTGCTIQDGNFDCLTGNCGIGGGGAGLGGDMLCPTTSQPSTLAEFTLGADGQDHYDISLVDGYNIGMSIVPSKEECPAPSCSKNINEKCPAVLQTGIDQNGVNTGCLSSCKGGFGAEVGGNRACCAGAHDKPATCPIEGVDFYNLFKDNCPDAYAYAYDDLTSIKTCSINDGMADYTIELCPESGSFLGKSTPSTEYANDFSKTPGSPASGNEAAGIAPSPTAAQPKSHLKITVSDGPAPPSPGSAVDTGSHAQGEEAAHVSGLRPSAPVASVTAASTAAPSSAQASAVSSIVPSGQPGGNVQSGTIASPAISPPVAPGVGEGTDKPAPIATGPAAPGQSAAAGGDRGGNGNGNGGIDWEIQQKGVVHSADTSASVADKAFPTAIEHDGTAAPSLSVNSASTAPAATASEGVNGGVVEGIIKGPTPHIDAHRPPGGGRCPSRNGGQAKRSGRVEAGGRGGEGGDAQFSDSPGGSHAHGYSQGRSGPARHHKAKSRRARSL